MCMIAFRPVKPGKRGSNIPHSVVETAMLRHPDGFGVAWRENGELHTQKFGPGDRVEFRDALRALDRRQGIEYVAHFRFATHGPRAESHAHPYEYVDPQEGRVLVFHNGIVDIPTKTTESDTEVFVRDVLSALPSAWWRIPAYRYLVDESIGWSKIVLMTATETVNLQETDGDWDGGIWYSSNHRPSAWEQYRSGRAITAPGWDASAKAWRTRTAGQAALIPAGETFVNAGHTLHLLEAVRRDVDGDYSDALMCDVCCTTGDLYVIGGETHIDIAHLIGGRYEDDEEENLLRDATLPVLLSASYQRDEVH